MTIPSMGDIVRSSPFLMHAYMHRGPAKSVWSYMKTVDAATMGIRPLLSWMTDPMHEWFHNVSGDLVDTARKMKGK
jgi:hypothetical protein